MASFSVSGPFSIPYTKQKVGRLITKENISAFWGTHTEIAAKRGCYVFGFKASKGSKPMYVGKATKTFKQEVFQDHKKNKYAQAFGSQAKGTPVMFFVSLNKAKGPISKSAIDEVETYLIQTGMVANKNLLNDKKTSVESWSISGLIRSKGKVPKQALDLRKMLKI